MKDMKGMSLKIKEGSEREEKIRGNKGREMEEVNKKNKD